MGDAMTFTSKYRPRSLKECVGLGTQKEAIKNMLASKNKPNFILITGGSGLGKSTIERIIAKSSYCTNFNKKKEPCGECESCKAFDKYIETGNSDNLPYVTDVNASLDNGKASIEAVIQEAEYPAPFGQHKYFILDEAHKLSDAAQNALLKPLEDEHSWATFIMSTTNPERLLSTVLSRVNFKIHLDKPSTEETVSLLKRICIGEEMEYQESALSLLAERELDTRKGIRSCVNTLNQILISYGDAKYDSVEKYYASTPLKTFFKFCSSLLEKKPEETITLLYSIKEKTDFRVFVDQLVEFVKKGIYIYSDINVTSVTASELKNFKALFNRFSIQEISVLLNSLRKAQRSNDIEADLMLLSFNGLVLEERNSSSLSKTTEVIIENPEKELHAEEVLSEKIGAKQLEERIENTKEKAKTILSEEVSLEELFN